MKTTNFFKMSLDNGEGEFKPSSDFKYEEPLLKLDIIKDWIDETMGKANEKNCKK